MKKYLCTFAALLTLFCMPMVSVAADPDALEIAPVDSLDTDQTMSGEGIPMLAEGIVTATPWGAPVLVSPTNGTKLFHYPRATTLAWQPVTGATSYKVEREFFSGATWTAYAPVTVTGINNTSYTFNFVGDQQGRWRVTAYNGTTASPSSDYWVFSYKTKPKMPTPVLKCPNADQVFSHFPRTLTLSWQMVPCAVGYKLEYSFCQAGNTNCVDYTPVIINDPLQSYYTFNFVGAQPGRWRVTVLGAPTYLDSNTCAWRYFRFDK
jgi:hypothetical protein